MTSRSRRLLGGAAAAAVLAGCSSPSPFDFEIESSAVASFGRSDPMRPTAPRAQAEAADDLPTIDRDATLDDYLRYAALRNAGLEARFHEWQAALERVPQVKALPDPRFTYGYYINEVETRVGPMRHTLALSQTLPWFGTLEDHEDAASRAANAAHERLETARLDLFYRIERAHNELFYLERSIAVTGDTIELLEQIERVARARYQVAAGGHPDIVRVQIELGTAEDRLRQLRDLRAPYKARLNAELNRSSTAYLPEPTVIADRVTDADAGDLLSTLRERNPELIALQEEIERERIGMQIARSDGLPDLTVGLAYTEIGRRGDANPPDNGEDALLATFSVNVPLWRSKYDAGVREALSRRLAVSSRHADATNRLASDLQEAMFEHKDARRRVSLYADTLIPKAEESLQASIASFTQGVADFLDLVDTQRTLLEFQLARERALVDRATSYARIERIVGTSLESIDQTGQPEEAQP